MPPLRLLVAWLRVQPQGSWGQIKAGGPLVSSTLPQLQKRSRVWKPSELMYGAMASEHREG